MLLTAYHHYLLRESKKDRRHLAVLLFMDVVEDRNPQAFELLESTGDIEYDEQTFLKAADILIITDNNENKEEPIGDLFQIEK
jgi:hypothetical protein